MQGKTEKLFFDIELPEKIENVEDFYEPPLVIGFAINYEEYQTLKPSSDNYKYASMKQLLENFAKLMQNRTMCGWNISNFDLPYLRGQYLRYSVKAPHLPFGNIKPWDWSIVCDYRFYLGFNFLHSHDSIDFMTFENLSKYVLGIDFTQCDGLERNQKEIEALQELDRRIIALRRNQT